jgi:hypothetical protein
MATVVAVATNAAVHPCSIMGRQGRGKEGVGKKPPVARHPLETVVMHASPLSVPLPHPTPLGEATRHPRDKQTRFMTIHGFAIRCPQSVRGSGRGVGGPGKGLTAQTTQTQRIQCPGTSGPHAAPGPRRGTQTTAETRGPRLHRRHHDAAGPWCPLPVAPGPLRHAALLQCEPPAPPPQPPLPHRPMPRPWMRRETRCPGLRAQSPRPAAGPRAPPPLATHRPPHRDPRPQGGLEPGAPVARPHHRWHGGREGGRRRTPTPSPTPTPTPHPLPLGRQRAPGLPPWPLRVWRGSPGQRGPWR